VCLHSFGQMRKNALLFPKLPIRKGQV
jgi:hypothetical protein